MFSRAAATATALVMAASWSGAGVVTSTFDFDADGWRIADSMDQPHQISIGLAEHITPFGNPGGFITVPDDFGTGEAAFAAPDKFHGNKLGALGSTFLQFDRRVWDPPHDNNPHQIDYAVDITIAGNGVVLGYDLPTATLRWTSYSVPIGVGMGWVNLDGMLPATHDDIVAVLSNLDDLRIRSNLNDSGVSAGIDNVTLIPAPAPIALLAVAGIVAIRRRR